MPDKAPVKEHITIRLSSEVVQRFRKTGYNTAARKRPVNLPRNEGLLPRHPLQMLAPLSD